MANMCECLPRIRETVLAREARFRADPAKPSPEGPQTKFQVKITSLGDLQEKAESIKWGHTWTISEPAHVGGLANAPTPLEYLLGGAAGCYAAVFAFYAAKLEVPYDTFEAVATAEFDARGHMMEDAPPAGFKRVHLEIKVGSSADPEQLAEVHRLALKGCPGISTLRDPVSIESSLTIQSSSQPIA